MAPHHNSYADATFMLLTQHGKERALGPVLEQGLGARVELVGGFDTDSLGTFTRDVPRAGNQREAARRKAQIAIERSGGRLGLGSEGAFNPGPFGIGSWDVEIVLCLDAERGIEVVGTAHGPGLHAYDTVTDLDALAEFADRAGFPDHALVMRPGEPDDPRTRKGIRSHDQLRAAFDEMRRMSASGAVFVESDLRAHMHPTRMALIADAGADLVRRLSTMCPACGLPGFGASQSLPGLPCSACGTPTDEPRADLYACVACECSEERARPGPVTANPGHCPYCNP